MAAITDKIPVTKVPASPVLVYTLNCQTPKKIKNAMALPIRILWAVLIRTVFPPMAVHPMVHDGRTLSHCHFSRTAHGSVPSAERAAADLGSIGPPRSKEFTRSLLKG